MDDANLNRRQTIRVGASVAYAQVGLIGFDGPIDLQSLRLYGLPEAAPAVLNGAPLLTGTLSGSGRRDSRRRCLGTYPAWLRGRRR
jgi:hypothetical protein